MSGGVAQKNGAEKLWSPVPQSSASRMTVNPFSHSAGSLWLCVFADDLSYKTCRHTIRFIGYGTDLRLKVSVSEWMSRGKAVFLPAMMKFGLGGLALLSLMDASSIPVPMDLVLAGFVWANRGSFWLYVLAASAGSAIGGLVPFALGRAGGELFLLRRMDRARFERIRQRFEKQEFFAVMVPSMLPPPTPWKAFVFAAGVFEMRVVPFVLAVFLGRVVRWMILSLLVLRFGPDAASLMSAAVHRHGWLVLSVLLTLVAGLAVWVWRRRRAESSLNTQ